MSSGSLAAGTRLGVYEVTAQIGEGGMGEVYRARDTRLDRDVAIKILPPLFAQDPARLSRFDREAKTLASLNHPNIAHIHGVVDSPAALVMELVEGEDLAQRLASGAIPLEEALPIARQIADALEAAHEQGIIHRDLKPANIKVRPDGAVKVLDFGLAKALSSAGQGVGPGSGDAALMNSPTFTSPAMTEWGVILGTAAYMSPEQARGKPVDRRADIWAFGCVLYEMLSGRRPFGGDDASMMLAAVLRQEVDFGVLPTETPRTIRRLLRRCLEKDPRKRLSSIADARLDLDDAAGEREPAMDAASAQASGTPRWGARIAWASGGAMVALLAAAVAAVLMLRPDPAGSAPVVHSQIPLQGKSLRISNVRVFALDPSGSSLVFSGAGESGPFLFRRRLATDEVMAIAGTEQGESPFFSPDGRWLAFIQRGRLKKMPSEGGGVVDLGEAGTLQGGSFMPDGSILFNAQHGEGLVRISSSGGDRAVVSVVDAAKGHAGHHWPDVLPDGKNVLVTVEVDGKPYSEARIMLFSLESKALRLLIDGGTDAHYLPTGHIVYWHDNALWSIPFDLATLQTNGPASLMVKDVMMGEANGHALYSVAANGTLAYISGRDVQQELGVMLVDRAGVARELLPERHSYGMLAVSADGRRLAVTIGAANDSIWTMDLDRPALTRITYEAENALPVWSPDGRRLVIARHSGGAAREMFLMPSDGSSAPELLHPSQRQEVPESWSTSGNVLAFSRVEAEGSDIWVMNMDGERTPKPFLNTRFDERHARFSPDGRWMAYTSMESGRPEVYVRAYPGPGQKRLVSTEGGSDARWRGDGRELFYRHRDAVVSVDVTTGDSLSTSPPKVLFRGNYVTYQWNNWEALPNGQGFLLIRDFAQPRTTISLIQNSFEELKARAKQ